MVTERDRFSMRYGGAADASETAMKTVPPRVTMLTRNSGEARGSGSKGAVSGVALGGSGGAVLGAGANDEDEDEDEGDEGAPRSCTEGPAPARSRRGVRKKWVSPRASACTGGPQCHCPWARRSRITRGGAANGSSSAVKSPSTSGSCEEPGLSVFLRFVNGARDSKQ